MVNLIKLKYVLGLSNVWGFPLVVFFNPIFQGSGSFPAFFWPEILHLNSSNNSFYGLGSKNGNIFWDPFSSWLV